MDDTSDEAGRPIAATDRRPVFSVMTGLNRDAWIRPGAWLAIGLVIYFVYSRRHSEFAATNLAASNRG